MVNREYCMSSYLGFRAIMDPAESFAPGVTPKFYDERFPRKPVRTSGELEAELRSAMRSATENGKAALALSGGIDSAVLAKFMPKGSVAYTFRCVVPGVEVTDESPAAARYARECGLEHRIVEIFWEDFEKYGPELMRHKGAPFHSIEIQICKAAERARKDGFECLIFGEAADLNYGGMDGLLSRDWTVGEFADRYWYVKSYQALRKPVNVLEPFLPYVEDGRVNVHDFLRCQVYPKSMGSYTNACDVAKVRMEAPYARTYMDAPLDLERVRGGESKYMVREIFRRLYPGFEVPPKLPMPRPTNEWMKSWAGPRRPEFWPHCTDNMTGDQRWLVYCLEWFLDLLDEGYLQHEKV